MTPRDLPIPKQIDVFPTAELTIPAVARDFPEDPKLHETTDQLVRGSKAHIGQPGYLFHLDYGSGIV